MMQDLARYWGTDYDWRQCESKLNALPNFITEIDGLDIHFIHVRSHLVPTFSTFRSTHRSRPATCTATRPLTANRRWYVAGMR